MVQSPDTSSVVKLLPSVFTRKKKDLLQRTPILLFIFNLEHKYDLSPYDDIQNLRRVNVQSPITMRCIDVFLLYTYTARVKILIVTRHRDVCTTALCFLCFCRWNSCSFLWQCLLIVVELLRSFLLTLRRCLVFFNEPASPDKAKNQHRGLRYPKQSESSCLIPQHAVCSTASH